MDRWIECTHKVESGFVGIHLGMTLLDELSKGVEQRWIDVVSSAYRLGCSTIRARPLGRRDLHIHPVEVGEILTSKAAPGGRGRLYWSG